MALKVCNMTSLCLLEAILGPSEESGGRETTNEPAVSMVKVKADEDWNSCASREDRLWN